MNVAQRQCAIPRLRPENLDHGAQRSWRPVGRRGLAARVCACSLILLFAVSAGAQVQDERTLRAAFVFNITKYVEWPHAPHELVIGYAGDGPMGASLQTMLEGKTSDVLVIHVVLLKPDDTFDACDLLYIGYSSPSKTKAALQRAGARNILTVGETESFTHDGGMVGLVRSGDRIRIEVNLALVQQSGLKISSRLLNLATIVTEAGGRG